MEDEKITQLYWDRNERAISATDEKYGNYCKHIAGNILELREDIEECVNDTYLSAWNSIPPHRPNILSVFLGKIIRNLSLSRYRYNHTVKRGGNEIPLILDELKDCVSGNNNVEQEIEYKELIQAINMFLGTVSPEKRVIFIRRYWYAENIYDIALSLKMKEGTVSVILQRLRKNLKKFLIERGFWL